MLREFTAVDYSAHLFSGYFIYNSRLTAIYNDDYDKYRPDNRCRAIPVLVQITNDGLMKARGPFEKPLNFDNIFYPASGT